MCILHITWCQANSKLLSTLDTRSQHISPTFYQPVPIRTWMCSFGSTVKASYTIVYFGKTLPLYIFLTKYHTLFCLSLLIKISVWVWVKRFKHVSFKFYLVISSLCSHSVVELHMCDIWATNTYVLYFLY